MKIEPREPTEYESANIALDAEMFLQRLGDLLGFSAKKNTAKKKEALDFVRNQFSQEFMAGIRSQCIDYDAGYKAGYDDGRQDGIESVEPDDDDEMDIECLKNFDHIEDMNDLF